MAKKLNPNGWTTLQEADPEKHKLEIDVRTEDSTVVEVRIRHNDGEETPVKAMVEGKSSLPMPAKDFEKLFSKNAIEFK